MGPRPAEHGPNDPGGVDLYVGGVEHAVLHLLYCAVLAQGALRPRPRQLAGAVPAAGQPGLHPGVRLHRRARRVRARRRSRRTRRQVLLAGPDGEIEVYQEFGKIGKSLKNSVSPDEICDDYGADTLRVYEMSMGPLEASRPWATKDVVGAYRFLQRVWRLVVDEQTGSAGRRRTRRWTTRRCGCCTARSPGCPRTTRRCATTPRPPS